MPEHIRALVVILCLATAVFYVVARWAKVTSISLDSFKRYRELWYLLTITAFLASNFWLYIVLIAIFLRIYRRRARDVISVAFFIVLAVPLISQEVPGILGINYLFRIDYYFVVSFVLFFPLFVQTIKAEKDFKSLASEPTDWLLFSYVFLNVALILVIGGGGYFTTASRVALNFLLVAIVPYVVISRKVNTIDLLKSALSAYVIGALVMAVIGIFESISHWLLYASLKSAFGLYGGLGSYLKRGETLRAIATAGQAIPYGYTMAIGFTVLLGLRNAISFRPLWWFSLVVFTLGIMASYSRGAGLAAVAGLIVYLATGRKKWGNLFKFSIVAVLASAVYFATPLGDKLYSVVVIDEGSYEYRAQVVEVSLQAILKNPIFGSATRDYMLDLESLRQGQGIIDIVNSYVAVALDSGLVGLTLFLGFFCSSIIGVARKLNSFDHGNTEYVDCGRAILATLICILVSIYTVSSISFIPIVYYMVLGLAVAYSRLSLKEDSTVLEVQEKVVRSRNRLKRGTFDLQHDVL